MALSFAQLPTVALAALPAPAASRESRSAAGGAVGSAPPSGGRLTLASQALALVAAGRLASQRRCRRKGRTALRVMVTGPGWTDEVARIMDPSEEGPRWQEDAGYRGRKRLRLVLDGEDLVHSYAKAAFERSGKFTGPLSMGIEKALSYGAWQGGAPPDPNPDRGPLDKSFATPEILTYVAVPADLVEAINPSVLVDGYPKDLREQVGRVMTGPHMEGYSINEWLRSLQDEGRLITWHRPARSRRGAPLPNTLVRQKYYKQGEVEDFKFLHFAPQVLKQVMGKRAELQVGETVEALKAGVVQRRIWLPSKWEKAKVVTCNYDGTYDLQFEQNFGPYHDRRTKGHIGMPKLSLQKNMVYLGFGADNMPAEFRYQQEMNYAMSVTPDKIRRIGEADVLGDLMDSEGGSDWYLCSSKEFKIRHQNFVKIPRVAEYERVTEFLDRFQITFRWVQTENGIEFQPTPNAWMERVMRVNHGEMADRLDIPTGPNDEDMAKLKFYKNMMEKYCAEVEDIKPLAPDAPSRPAGPKLGMSSRAGHRKHLIG